MNSQSHLFSKRNIFISTALVLAAGLIFGFLSKSESQLVNKANVYDELPHPFTVKSTNLLNEISSEDKLKSRLNKYDIRLALDEVFLSEDFDIITGENINLENVNIPITTYDSKTNIGYVLIDYDRFGAGLLNEKLGKALTLEQGELQFLKMIDMGVELYFDDNEKFLDDVFGKVKSDEEQEDEVDEESYQEIMSRLFQEFQKSLDNGVDRNIAMNEYRIEAAKHPRPEFEVYHSVVDDWDFFRNRKERKSEIVKNFGQEVRDQLGSFSTSEDQKEYLEIILQELKMKLEIDYLSSIENKSMFDEWKLSAVDIIEEPSRYFGFLAMVDNIRIYSPTIELSKVLNEQIFEIVIESDKQDWWSRGRAVFDLFNANENPGLYSKESYKLLLADIMMNSNYTNWSKRYPEIKALGDDENISLKELNSLNTLAIENRIYIAPISILDDRMVYDMEEDIYLDSLATLRTAIGESKIKNERKDLQKRLLELTDYRANNYALIRTKAKAKSIERLKADMCDYIQWAREQIVEANLDRSA